MKIKAAFLVLALLMTPQIHADVLSAQWVQAWRDDLNFVQKQLPDTHPHLFHTLSEADFNSAVETLSERLPSLSHHEVIVELAAIVAAINDGHTRLTLPMVEGSQFFAGHSPTPMPNSPKMLFNHFPIRLYIYEDGLYVEKTSAKNAAFAGARVVQIGHVSAREAMEKVSSVVQRDNDEQLKHLIPSRLVVPEILHALEITDSVGQGKFVIETANGERHQLVLSPVKENKPVDWVDSNNPSGQLPLYLRHKDVNFWFEQIEDTPVVYWQYNEVYDMPGESLAEFALRLTDYIEKHEIQQLIIDLRFNSGGDNQLNRSLLHALIRAPELQHPGSLFVITGRGTFSAAMMFAVDLEKQTNAIFVGEPTGASPNHYGDSRKIHLPNSGLTIRVSTLYWQYSGPKDKRRAISPHIPATLFSQDYLNNRDPALSVILNLSARQPSDISPVGKWSSRVLGYETVVNVSSSSGKLAATIDFTGLDAYGLPLKNVSFLPPELTFDFPNGENVISFEGILKGDVIIGKAIMHGQTYPWVALNHQALPGE